MEKVHVLVDGDACFGGSFFDWLLLYLEREFGLPILAFSWKIHQEIPCGILVAVYAMDNLFCGRVLGHLLQVVTFAAALQVMFQVVALGIDGNRIA